MGTVTTIFEYRARETIACLEQLLQEARRGEISGFAFACKRGDHDHGIGLTGNYRDDPLPVLAVTSRIDHVVNDLIDARSIEEPTSGVPLA